jgi:predicted nucleic acid-binding protein
MDRLMKGLIVDANILVSAALGTRVRNILEEFHRRTNFSAPDVCRPGARKKIPDICRKHGLNQNAAFDVLTYLEKIVDFVELQNLAFWEKEARRRIPRDSDDRPVVATALALDLPIWTEDRDFFGCGVATWITNTVEICLATPTRID